MHINDVYALKSLLNSVAQNKPVDLRVLTALQDAVQEEVQAFETHLEELAYREEAAQC